MDDEEKQRNYQLAEKLLSEQNFVPAVIAGAVATVLASAAYGILVNAWPMLNGFGAAGIGVVIGATIGFLGRGITTKFRVMAAAYTLAGCFLGNVCVVITVLVRGGRYSIVDVLRENPISELADKAAAYIAPIDFVFWFVGIVAAVFLAKRPLSRSDRLAIGMYELRG